MSICSTESVLEFIGDYGEDDYTIGLLHKSIEGWAKIYCRREFESTSYPMELYSGHGGRYLSLRQRPISAMTLLAIGTRDIVRITNTFGYTTASVSVTDTSIVCEKDSVLTTLDFADYPKISAMVTAINSLGNGWLSYVASSEYDNFSSSYLMKRFGANAIANTWVYLYVPNEGESEFSVLENRGQLYRTCGFPNGTNNIIVSYTAGYTSDNMPQDLQLGIKIIVKYFYKKWKEEKWNIESFKIGDVSEKLSSKDFPSEALSMINMYRRMMV